MNDCRYFVPLFEMKKILIEKSLAEKIMMVSVIYKTDGPAGGGVSSVLQSYSCYMDGMRHIATWKDTNKLNKIWYFVYHYVYFFFVLLFDRRVRIVHIHTADGPSFERKSAMMRLAKKMGKKVILHMHAASFHEYYNRSQKKKWIFDNVNLCDRLIVLSPWWKKYFLDLGIDKNKITILNNIVDVPPKVQYRDPSNPIRFTFLGHLGKRKGIWDFLRVIDNHQNELREKFIFRFGGNGLEKEISEYISTHGISDLAIFEGWVNGEKKTELLKWADIFVLPSYNEGLPISILEALAFGMPIISTPVGGIPEVVKHGVNGMIVEPGSDSQIWDAIQYYLNNPSNIRKEGLQSSMMVEPYTPVSVMGHLMTIYNQLLDK